MSGQPRPVRAEEAGRLTALCLRSKASHGYDRDFMAACLDELTVIPGFPGHRLAVVDQDGVPVGLAEVSTGRVAELEKLFVEPTAFGRGIGRMLFDWARREAITMGADWLAIDSDPGAVGFYRAMGAVKAGSSPSASIQGRMLPRLMLDLRAP